MVTDINNNFILSKKSGFLVHFYYFIKNLQGVFGISNNKNELQINNEIDDKENQAYQLNLIYRYFNLMIYLMKNLWINYDKKDEVAFFYILWYNKYIAKGSNYWHEPVNK